MGSTKLIPGANIIGWGMNVYSTYNAVKNKIKPILDLSETQVQTISNGNTGPGDSIEYNVPKDASVTENAEIGTIVSTGTQANSIATAFQEQASISGGGWGFSGQASQSYGSYAKESSSYNFFTLYGYQKYYKLQLGSLNASNLTSDFTANQAYMSILAEYNKQGKNFVFNETNRNLFFELFTTYGFYYVDSVTMGGYLSFNTITSKSAKLSSTEITASAKASYDGLFVSVSAEASASWKQVSSEFISNTTVNVYAGGGNATDITSLAITSLSDDQNNHKDFESWADSCWGNPEPAYFTLQPIENIFSDHPELKEAFKAARTAWVSGAGIASLNLTVSPSSSVSLLLNGNPVDVDFTPLSSLFRYNSLIDYYGPYSQPYYPYPVSKGAKVPNNNPQFAWGAFAIPRSTSINLETSKVNQIQTTGSPPQALANLFNLGEDVPYIADSGSSIFNDVTSNQTIPDDFYKTYIENNPDNLLLFYWTGMLTGYLPIAQSDSKNNIFLTQYAPEGALRTMLTKCGATLKTNWNNANGALQGPSGNHPTYWNSLGASTAPPSGDNTLPDSFVPFYDSPYIYIMLGYYGSTKANEYWVTQGAPSGSDSLSMDIPLFINAQNEFSWESPY